MIVYNIFLDIIKSVKMVNLVVNIKDLFVELIDILWFLRYDKLLRVIVRILMIFEKRFKVLFKNVILDLIFDDILKSEIFWII